MEETGNNTLPISSIVLSRGESGLGFNIRGGVDNPHIPGDTGIFVTKVRENGAAFADGRLKEGDKILSINGKQLDSVTHEDAVLCFTKAKETVSMEVQHGAQDDILKRRRKEKEIEANIKQQQSASSNKLYYVIAGVAVITAGFIVYKKFGTKYFPFAR